MPEQQRLTITNTMPKQFNILLVGNRV